MKSVSATKSRKRVVLSGSFDDLRSQHVRLLQEAARLGSVHVLLWSDESVRRVTGTPPKFPQTERKYLVEAIRFVERVVDGSPDLSALSNLGNFRTQIWAVAEADDSPATKKFCREHGIEYCVLRTKDLAGFPMPEPELAVPGRKKAIVTGCFDWFHSGHVRFFEEVARFAELYVVVGHDENVRLLKGEGHPMFAQDERCYMVGAVRHVKQALIATGHGWMDAAPEIERIQPDLYVVNEDGDRPEKREFCQTHRLEYVVLTRTPKPGLIGRTSTSLRGNHGARQ